MTRTMAGTEGIARWSGEQRAKLVELGRAHPSINTEHVSMWDNAGGDATDAALPATHAFPFPFPFHVEK